MPRKIILAALLCLALCQTANAQYPTLQQAIAGELSVYASSIHIYFHVSDVGHDNGDGYTYDVVSLACCQYNTSNLRLTVSYGTYCFKHNASGWSIVTSFPVLSHPRSGVINIATSNLELSGTFQFTNHLGRYYCTYDDLCTWVYGFNDMLATYPRTRADCVAAFDLPISPTGTFVLSSFFNTQRNPVMLTQDRDNGGVPDWFEFYGNPYYYTDPGNKDDDVLCYCMPCCECQCVCGHYVPDRCDGTTDLTTGCACHDGTIPDDPGNPDDPDEPPPALSPNAPPLLRALLFLVCMYCGAGFFGCFMDSFEKGSF